MDWFCTGACVNLALLTDCGTPPKWQSWSPFVHLYDIWPWKQQVLASYARVLQLVHANGAISVLKDYSGFTKDCRDCQVFVITVQWPSTTAVSGNMSISSSSSSRRCCHPPLGCQVPCAASPSRTAPQAWTPVAHPDACSMVGFVVVVFGGCSLFVVVYI